MLRDRCPVFLSCLLVTLMLLETKRLDESRCHLIRRPPYQMALCQFKTYQPLHSGTNNDIICMCVITFCVGRRRRKCIVVTRVCVCVCVSVSGPTPTLLHGPGCNLAAWWRLPLVVHCWADLQSAHGLRCYGNITQTLVTSLRPYCDMTT